MSPQREGETEEMYMYRLELTQEDHETRLSKVEFVAMEAREMAVETKVLVLSMPQEIIKAIDEREIQKRKEQKMDSREKLFIAMGIIGTLGGVAGAIASIKQVLGG
jgi:hypothetical protein